MSKTSSLSGYKVGRGRPPRHSQFKKGQSGNPGGKRKRAPSLKGILSTVMTSEIVLKEGGRPRSAIIMEAIFLALSKAALHGNTKAASILIELYERHRVGEEDVADVLSGEDREIIARAIERRVRPDELQCFGDPETGEGDE